jgi:peptidoglycan/xylan/chitin deacetylase (PgdA/CDA1 family)
MNLPARVRLSLQFAWARLLQASGCLWWAKRQLRRRGAVMVLTFHRVLNDAEFQRTCSLPAIVIRRQTFNDLAVHVAGRYEAVDFIRAIEAPSGKLRVMFTFDDGWKDNYTNALPVTRAHGVPLTAFVCPGLIGRALPFWPELVASLLGKTSPPISASEVESVIENLKVAGSEHRQQYIGRLHALHAPADIRDAYDSDRTVSWDDIREMDMAGVSFGCHTHTHQILTTVSAQTAREEVRESKQAVEGVLHRRCDLFAYPNGNSSAATRRMLAAEGFAGAFTTQRGAWTSDTDRMAIPRVNMCEASVVGPTGRFSPAMFQYNVFWKAWRAMRDARRVPVKPRPERVLSEA